MSSPLTSITADSALSASRQLRAVDWTNATPLLTPPSRLPPSIRPQVLQHAHPLFALRVVPSRAISSPPDQRIDGTPFAVVASIKAVSKLAVERRRVKTRFKAAVRMALTRGARTVAAGSAGSREDRQEREAGDPKGTGRSVLLANDGGTDVQLVPGRSLPVQLGIAANARDSTRHALHRTPPGWRLFCADARAGRCRERGVAECGRAV